MTSTFDTSTTFTTSGASEPKVEPVLGPRQQERSKHIFPGLFKERAITLISVSRRVNSEPLAMVLALKASRPGKLPLFGQSSFLETVICHGTLSGDERADSDELWEAIHAAEQNENAVAPKQVPTNLQNLHQGENEDADAPMDVPTNLQNLHEGENEDAGAPKDVPTNLQKLHQGDFGTASWYMDDQDSSTRLQAQVPGNALVIFYDIKKWMKASPTQESYEAVATNLDEWCRKGHTVIVFETEPDEGALSLKAALSADVDVLRASWDDGAPHELGGGCIITRKKKGYFDLGPQRFNFWFKVFRQEFEWGMEVRPDGDALGGKQMEVYQRRMLVDSWLKDGMPQKEIALLLGRDAATISRDVEALRNKSW